MQNVKKVGHNLGRSVHNINHARDKDCSAKKKIDYRLLTGQYKRRPCKFEKYEKQGGGAKSIKCTVVQESVSTL